MPCFPGPLPVTDTKLLALGKEADARLPLMSAAIVSLKQTTEASCHQPIPTDRHVWPSLSKSFRNCDERLQPHWHFLALAQKRCCQMIVYLPWYTHAQLKCIKWNVLRNAQLVPFGSFWAAGNHAFECHGGRDTLVKNTKPKPQSWSCGWHSMPFPRRAVVLYAVN